MIKIKELKDKQRLKRTKFGKVFTLETIRGNVATISAEKSGRTFQVSINLLVYPL